MIAYIFLDEPELPNGDELASIINFNLVSFNVVFAALLAYESYLLDCCLLVSVLLSFWA